MDKALRASDELEKALVMRIEHEYGKETLKAIGAYDKNTDAVIVVGRKDSIPEDIPKERLIIHGTCTRKWRDRGL